MGVLTKLIPKAMKLTPLGLRRKAKLFAEKYFDLARRSFYSDYGEDAFLQAYFRQTLYARYPGLPLHMYQNLSHPGFYVDIGAYSPKLFSTTYWFYQHGWRGINVDATPMSMKLFQSARPKDTNVEAAISTLEGSIPFYCWDRPSPLNTLSPDRANELAVLLGRTPETIAVRAMRLSTLLDRYLPTGQSISFMTIDVEKHDLQVLQSNQWDKYRPELVLVESHIAPIAQIVEADTTRFMLSVGYEIYAWIKPTVVYRQSGLADPLVA